jgi:hypothetical protein
MSHSGETCLSVDLLSENDSCCPIQYIYRQLISYILERTSLISIRWWWCPLGTWPTRIYIVLAYWLNQQFADRHVATTRTHYSHSESLLLLYNTAFLEEKIRIPILKFLVWPQRDLEPLHHRCGSVPTNQSWKYTSYAVPP